MIADAYPVTPPEGDDPRFTFGLAIDVARVLELHDYPAPVSGADWLELQQALWRFLYAGRPA